MAAKTFDEFWKILEVPHSRLGDDYVFIKELSEVVWKAAIKAAEEKFTSTNKQSDAITLCKRAVVLYKQGLELSNREWRFLLDEMNSVA